jgi:hypothetical protein
MFYLQSGKRRAVESPRVKSVELHAAQSSILSGLYNVPLAVGTGLDKSLDDLRNKKLFDFGHQDTDKVLLKGMSKPQEARRRLRPELSAR